MVLSIYDNTQISSFGIDLLGFRIGIFIGLPDEPAVFAIVGSALR